MYGLQAAGGSPLLVSVIIPVYNVKSYLAEAIDSVICQSYTNLEIIVVDDGSNDGSSEICDRYAACDRRIRLIRQPNRGLSAARNAGLDAMTGQVVAFLDSDDSFHPDMIRRMLDKMVSEQADAVICKYSTHFTTDLITPKNAKSSAPRPLLSQGNYDRVGVLRALASGQLDHVVWNRLYSRTLWQSLRFPEGHVFEDVEINFRILDIVSRVYVTDDLLVYHRIRPGSITSDCTSKAIQDRLLSHAHFESFVAEHVPELFSEKQLRNVRIRKFCAVLVMYMHFIQQPGMLASEAGIVIRQQLIVCSREFPFRALSLNMAAVWLMIRFCPRLAAFSYSVYRRLRMLFRLKSPR